MPKNKKNLAKERFFRAGFVKPTHTKATYNYLKPMKKKQTVNRAAKADKLK